LAASRHLPSSALLVVLVAALAAIPGLFLFQGLVRHARQGREQLVADLVVRLEGRPPYHLTVQLQEQPPAPDGGGATFQLAGRGRMRADTYPWGEVPREALLEIDLPQERVLAGRAPLTLTIPDGTLAARYLERALGTPEGSSMAIVCRGDLTVSRLAVGEGAQGSSWARVHRFEGTLDLRCDASGPDRRSGTADDVHYTLVGTLDDQWEGGG